ncbi:MAG TPA: hypothetical protein VHF26_01440 [Trebonia sp.]|nr:hypothetical protein [Trebonia sp.]
MAAFTVYALRLARRNGQPLVDISVLARRPVASASAVLFFTGLSLYGAMLSNPMSWPRRSCGWPRPRPPPSTTSA